MKDYKILLISFVLLVFMIGAVSATSVEDATVEAQMPPIVVIDDDPIVVIDDDPVVIDDDPVDVEVDTKDIYVSDAGDDSNTGSEESPYATIGKAISDVNASNIATIHIGEGTFISDDDSNFNIQLLHKSNGGSLTFIGAGADKTFIDGQSAFRFATFGYNTNITIKDISFINFKQGNGAVISNNGGILTIENCVFKDVYSTGHQGGAIYMTNNNGVLTVKDSSFISCSANGQNNWQAGGGAIYARNIDSLTLINNNFIATSIVRGSGVAVYSNSKTYIDGNKFINLTGTNDASIFVNDLKGSTICNNQFINCSNPSTTYSIVNIAYGSSTMKNNTFINSTNSVGNIYSTGTINGLNFTIDEDLIDVGNDEINNGVYVSVNVTDDMGNIVKISSFKLNFVNENNTYTFNPSSRNGKFYFNFNSMPEVGIYNVTITSGDTTSDALSTADIHYSNEIVDLYVSPEGADENNGTINSPFATIQHAVDVGFEKTFNVAIHLLKGTYSGEGNVEITIANKGTLQILGEKYGETIIDGNEETWFFHISTESTLKNLKFVNGYGDSLITGNEKVSLIDCIMDSNNGEGSSILSNVNIDNLTFTNNKGHYSISAQNIKAINSYFANNTNEYGPGGAIAIENWISLTKIENCKFINNTAGETGGALYCGDAYGISIENCYFDGNYAPNGGAIFNPAQGIVTVTNTTFINNKADVNGVFGGVDSSMSFISPALKFNDCRFINNSATKAAVSTIKIGIFEGCSFINNTADYGGVFVLLPYAIEPENPVFIDYETEEIIDSLELNDVIFENNIARINGKDIYLEKHNYWEGDEYLKYAIPLTITFNDLNVTSLVDDLTANVSGPCGTVIGSFYDLIFELNGSKVGSAKINNGVSILNYAGFDDGEYVLSGNTYLVNPENVVNDAKVIVKLENVLDHVEFWVSPEGSDENGNGSESNPFKSISHAVAEASKNCRNITIHLTEGNFAGALNTALSLSSMNNIVLAGAGVDKTIIDGENTTYFATVTDGKNKVIISDLTIKNMLPDNRQSQVIDSASPITVDEGANLLLDNVELSDNHGGDAIIVNNGNLTIANSVITKNGISLRGLIIGGNIFIDNSTIFDNYVFTGYREVSFIQAQSVIVNNTSFKDNYLIIQYPSNPNFVLIKATDVIIENTNVTNDGDNESLINLGIVDKSISFNPALSISGNINMTNTNMVNNFKGKIYTIESMSQLFYPCALNDYGAMTSILNVYNSSFVNFRYIWMANGYCDFKYNFDGCVFKNITYLAHSRTVGPDTEYNISNSVFLFDGDVIINQQRFEDTVVPNVNFNNNYWGNNSKPTVYFLGNMGIKDETYSPDTWIVLYSEDEQTVIKNLTDGENITAYTGNAPIRTDYADNNGALDYAVVFGPVGYLFTTDDDKNVIFNPEDAMYPFEAADPMDYRTPSVITITGLSGDLGIVGVLVDPVGNPIANATIASFVNGENVANVTTDEDGAFTVKGIKNGVLTILFNGTVDYFDTEYNLTFANAGKTTKSFINLDTVESDLAIRGTLVDDEGNPIANATITYAVNGANATEVTTDDNGVFTVQGASDSIISIDFNGNDAFDASNINITLKNLSPVRQATLFNSSDFTQYSCDFYEGERGGNFTFQLVDEMGNPIANKTIYIGYNGVTLNRTTDENGFANVQINLKNAGLYTFVIVFLGDEDYNATMAVHKVNIEKKTTSISASAKTYKATAKTKKYTVTLKTIKGSSIDGKTYLAKGKKVTLTINGKTYTAKTNAKGQATFSLKITKKGKFAAKVSFAGDNTYKEANKSVKLTIK